MSELLLDEKYGQEREVWVWIDVDTYEIFQAMIDGKYLTRVQVDIIEEAFSHSGPQDGRSLKGRAKCLLSLWFRFIQWTDDTQSGAALIREEMAPSLREARKADIYDQTAWLNSCFARALAPYLCIDYWFLFHHNENPVNRIHWLDTESVIDDQASLK